MNNVITIHDIHKRLRGINQRNTDQYMLEHCAKHVDIALENAIPKDLMKSIETIVRHSNPVMFESALQLFDALYEHGTTSQMVKMCNYICEEAVPRVRDAKETNTNLKRKIGRTKSKIATKISNNIADAQNEVLGKIHAAQGNFKKNTQQIKNNVNKGLKPMKKNEAYIECYEKISEALGRVEDCDRILENYDMLSRRYNLEKIIIENTRMNDYQDTVHELAKLIDTYNMPNIVKFNTLIETAWYGFEQNGIKYDKSKLLETASDYFMMKPNGYKDCMTIFENTVIFKPEDMPEGMQVLTEIDPKDNPPEGVFQTIDHINDSIMDTLSESTLPELVMEGTDFNKIFSDYKKENGENKESKLMMLVRKMYTKNVSNIVDGTPNFLNWIRLVLVLGTCAIHPVVLAVAAIGDIFARLHFERSETEKMIKCFDDEIKKTNAKIKSTKNAEEQQRLKAYLKSLKDAKRKIDDYYDQMLTDKELDNKYSGSDEKDSFDDLKADITDGADKDDDDFGDFDMDWDDDEFLEAAVDTISIVGNIADSMPDFNRLNRDIINSTDMFNADDIDALSKLTVMYPDVWSPELMENVYLSQINKIHKGKVMYENALARYLVLNAYNAGLNSFKSIDRKIPNTIGSYVSEFALLSEAANALDMIIETHKNKNLMVEASFTNSLKMASEKLKKTMVKLSDKDRTMSKNIDVTLSQFKKAVENSLTNDNREAVIKGSVLPSASKIIKLAITTGALWLVQPALAVITCLGYLGLSSKHKIKERQLILDEIEIELKMCQKYIDIAESKDDMKALKELLTIQRNLQRQQQRIKYKMKVDFNQNPHSPDDED